MQSEQKDADKGTEGAVLLLLHCEDNRRALRKLLNLAVDMELPHTFRALLDELGARKSPD
jgi:hypothetical protein